MAEAASSSLRSCFTGMVSGDTIEDDEDFDADDDLEAERGAVFTIGCWLADSPEASLGLVGVA